MITLRVRYCYVQSLTSFVSPEITRRDHFIIASSRHIYVWCCSSRTSRSWSITQSTQHHRRGCNNTTNDICVRRTHGVACHQVRAMNWFSSWKWQIFIRSDKHMFWEFCFKVLPAVSCNFFWNLSDSLAQSLAAFRPKLGLWRRMKKVLGLLGWFWPLLCPRLCWSFI